MKAVHNGTWVAFLLAWTDATKNSVMYLDTFRDAVALPVRKQAAFTLRHHGVDQP